MEENQNAHIKSSRTLFEDAETDCIIILGEYGVWQEL